MDGRIELVFGTDAFLTYDPIHHVVSKFKYLEKYGYFPLELCPKLRTCISPWHVDRRNVLPT